MNVKLEIFLSKSMIFYFLFLRFVEKSNQHFWHCQCQPLLKELFGRFSLSYKPHTTSFYFQTTSQNSTMKTFFQSNSSIGFQNQMFKKRKLKWKVSNSQMQSYYKLNKDIKNLPNAEIDGTFVASLKIIQLNFPTAFVAN